MSDLRRTVFIVYGRNEQVRKSMFSFLRSIGLSPLEWTQAIQLTGQGSPYIGEIVDKAFENAQAIVVILTPDDEARLRPELLKVDDPSYEREYTYQARPNVLFEAGMAFGKHPDRTILVQVGELRPFSDIAGKHIVKLNDSTQSRQEFANRLQTAKCDVNLTGIDWHTEGTFSIKFNQNLSKATKAIPILSSKLQPESQSEPEKAASDANSNKEVLPQKKRLMPLDELLPPEPESKPLQQKIILKPPSLKLPPREIKVVLPEKPGKPISRRDIIIAIEKLKQILMNIATGPSSKTDPETYKKLRQILFSYKELRERLPVFLETCENLEQFWQFIKAEKSHYQERRIFLVNEFKKAIDFLNTSINDDFS